MTVEDAEFTMPGDEFALVAQAAAEAGTAGKLPKVRRGWVNVPAGGHVSGVFWGDGQPEVVLLHDIGESARAWDAVAVGIAFPSVAIDLPGHGRSDWRRDGRYEPAKLAPAIAEAIRSFAPRARLVVGTGLGGRTALALRRRHARLVPSLALLPGRRQAWSAPERFTSQAEALTALAARHPGHSEQSLRREILYELSQDPDGSWVWRHHPGNLHAEPGDAGWSQFGELGGAVAVIRGHSAGSPEFVGLAALLLDAPDARVITIAGGSDVVATAPAALSAALDELVTTTAVEES
jgi:pimeloyl-ACP methyl ester carboxylesterase